MNRNHFFKSLLTLAVVPKIISEIDFNKKVTNLDCKINNKLQNDLNLLTPSYYKQMVAKYGNENYYNCMMTFHDKI